jgi:hypothetical protein
MIFTIDILMMNLGMYLSNLSFLKFNHKIMALISIVGISSSIFVLSFVEQFHEYLIFYGIFFGLFIGYGYMAPIKNCYEHIPNKKGRKYII